MSRLDDILVEILAQLLPRYRTAYYEYVILDYSKGQVTLFCEEVDEESKYDEDFENPNETYDDIDEDTMHKLKQILHTANIEYKTVN